MTSPVLIAKKTDLTSRVAPTLNTTAVAPTVGKLNQYDTYVGGALAPALPAANSVVIDTTIGFKKSDSGATTNLLTPTCSGSDHIDAAGGSTTLPIALKNEIVWFTSDGVSVWTKSSGAHSFTSMDSRWGGTNRLANKTGWYVPADWGQYGRPKLAQAKAGSALARVAVVGDSITQGWYCSDPATKSYGAILGALLQALAGDGGSGFRSAVRSAPWGELAGYSGSAAYVTTTGSTFSDPAHLDGPGWSALTASASGATWAFSVRGTTVTVYGLQATTTGSVTVAVDGGSAISVNTAGGAKGIWSYVVTVAPGTHNVVVTSSSATAVYINGVQGRNASGVVVDIFCHKSQPSNAVNNTVGTTFLDTGNTSFGGASSGTFGPGGAWSGGYANPADLIILEFGANDVALATPNTADAYIQNLHQYLAGVRNGNGAAGTTAASQDIILLATHIGQRDTNFLWAEYCVRLSGLAETYGAAMINLWADGKNSWQTWNALGYWGVAGNLGAAGTDTTHWSDAGHAYVGNQLYALAGALS